MMSRRASRRSGGATTPSTSRCSPSQTAATPLRLHGRGRRGGSRTSTTGAATAARCSRSCERALRLDALRGLFADLVVLVDDTLGARDERRLQVFLDRLLRDHALGDIPTRRQL